MKGITMGEAWAAMMIKKTNIAELDMEDPANVAQAVEVTARLAGLSIEAVYRMEPEKVAELMRRCLADMARRAGALQIQQDKDLAAGFIKSVLGKGGNG